MILQILPAASCEARGGAAHQANNIVYANMQGGKACSILVCRKVKYY